ncbi:hypothetical protein BN946_scf184866.g13 [Trametes cinnabarina]|uniref:Uncharacterized protein n=1 Tax=Pycnoporus cinnabarinus TaxID=5643 RepID=A0A060SKW3_PYCCI|nr:hypothetical protein BN946_scf184866.g13 [Trametes cinnabarina]
MRLRMDAEGVAMVQEDGIGPLDVQKKQKRAHTTGTTPTALHDVGAPRIARPLVKAVGKATDKIVRLVYNKPKDKVHGKLAEGDNAAVSPPVPGGWNDARSGITVVVESECDAGGTTPKAGFSARHNQSQISIETTPDMCLYISPPEPHNSVSTEPDEDEPPYLDEQTAMQLINCLYYGDEEGEQNGGVAAAAAVAVLRTSSEIHHQPLGARIQQRPQPKQQQQPTPEPQEQEQEPQYAKRQEHVLHPHIRPTSVPPLIKPASPTPARTNVLQLVILPRGSSSSAG